MGYFRFRRSFRVLPDLRLNLSKSGVSTSIGRRGAWFTVGPKGTRTTVGLPGTGISHTSTHSAYPVRPKFGTPLVPSLDSPSAPTYEIPTPSRGIWPSPFRALLWGVLLGLAIATFVYSRL